MTHKTTEYASTLYNTPRDATRAAVSDWLTSCGRDDMPTEIPEEWIGELHELHERGEWTIPNEPNLTREALAALMREVIERGY